MVVYCYIFCSFGEDGGKLQDTDYADPLLPYCGNYFADHCRENPTDSGCQQSSSFYCRSSEEHCPRFNDFCDAVQEIGICKSESCETVEETYKAWALGKGAFQPEDTYYRSMNEGSIMDFTGDFSPQAFTEEHGEEVAACDHAVNILECAYSTIQYCNVHPWDHNCKELSVCGDGWQTWGEQCDDGNTLDFDGCDPTCDYQ